MSQTLNFEVTGLWRTGIVRRNRQTIAIHCVRIR
jgi:hypothetical protein